jgi:hypothetical protein
MLRTLLSVALLFGSLLLVSKWLHQSCEKEPPASRRPQASQAAALATGLEDGPRR